MKQTKTWNKNSKTVFIGILMMLCLVVQPERAAGFTLIQLLPEKSHSFAQPRTAEALNAEQAKAIEEAEQLPMLETPGEETKDERVIARYEDDHLRVRVEKHLVGTTNCYVAYIEIADPSQLRVAAAYSFDRKQTAKPSDIARRVGAVLAINGDYYSYYGGGYMVRDGVQYGDRPVEGRDVLLIDEHGDFYIEHRATSESMESYSGMQVMHAFNFGPGLVIDGQVLGGYYAKFNASDKPRQRSCIAQRERGKLEYICVSCEGPVESEDGGLTMQQFAAFVHSLGVENAYNLDGGDSTALVFEGEKLNAAENKKHRAVSDIIYFVSAGEGQ